LTTVAEKRYSARVDFSLKVGATSETISVEANTVAVQTDSGEVSGVITGHQLNQLATNGRSIYTLVNLTPGVYIDGLIRPAARIGLNALTAAP
jgi:hypothetical protein